MCLVCYNAVCLYFNVWSCRVYCVYCCWFLVVSSISSFLLTALKFVHQFVCQFVCIYIIPCLFGSFPSNYIVPGSIILSAASSLISLVIISFSNGLFSQVLSLILLGRQCRISPYSLSLLLFSHPSRYFNGQLIGLYFNHFKLVETRISLCYVTCTRTLTTHEP